MVNDPAFKSFGKFFNPRVSVKDPTTLKKYILPLLFNAVMDVVKSELEKDLPDCRGVALTTDCWISKAEGLCISLTLHYTSKKLKLKKFILNFDNFTGRHTSYFIAKVPFFIFTKNYVRFQ